MKKFLVLYRSTVSMKEQMMSMTQEKANANMQGWMSWYEKSAHAVVEMGAPLGDSAVLRGTADAGNIGGYSVIQAESIDAAKRMFEAHPHFEAPGASIELLELMPTPGK